MNRKHLANAIRALSMDGVQQANSGHPGAPMGMADIAEGALAHSPESQPAKPKLGRPRPVCSLEWAWVNADLFTVTSDRI
ncbi:hypothetical protein P4S72_07305 [Vibrio sp. PP-XX7]